MNDISLDYVDFFNKERINRFVSKFSFPRLAGTEGEKEAVELVSENFNKIGFNKNQIIKEKFEFSDFYSTTLIKIIAAISLNALLVFVLVMYLYYVYTFIIIGVMAVFIFLIGKGLKHPEKKGFWGEYFGKTHEATNVFVKIPAKRLNEKEAGNIIVSAHLDSKSQSFKTYWRVLVYRIWLFCGLILGASYFYLLVEYIGFKIINPSIVEIFNLEINVVRLCVIVLTAIISSSNIMLMFLNTYNNSPGALDNASGMAIVFELSNYFKKRDQLDNFNVWFCQFSAEELGTMGSRNFVNNHENQFVKNKTFQINFDMVSAANRKKNQAEYLKSYGVLPRKKISPLLSTYFEEAAKKEKIKIHGFHLSTGAHLDSVPFHLRGFDAIDITTRAGAILSHSKLDAPDKVDARVLIESCKIALQVMGNLDKDYKTLCEI